MQKNSRSAFESVSVRCNNGSVWANCKDGTFRAIVVFSQSGGALHLDLSLWISLFSLLLCLSNCEQFHSLRTYRTSVFPLSLYRNESSVGERTLYKTLLLIRILRKTVRQEQIQDTKIDTKPNQRVHHRIERACSWIESVFLLCLPISNWKFHRAAFLERLCSPVEPLEQIQCWNLAYRTEGWVGSVSELNERVYHTVESSVQNTNRICFATELNESCSSIKQTCSLSLWLCPSYRSFSRDVTAL